MDIDEFFNKAKVMRPSLLSIAKKILGDEEEAEDVVQDAMLRLWQLKNKNLSTQGNTKPGNIRNAESLIKIMVRNLSIDIVRRRKNYTDIEDKDICDDINGDYDEEQTNRVMALMQNLPTMQQTVLRLRHIEGMDMADIARLVGSTEQAVRQSLSRGRRTILKNYKTSIK